MSGTRVIIDAGHGGEDPGAVYNERREKDDNLRLALAVGEILSNEGIDVAYTRVTDIYQTPAEKAQIANRAEGDYFLSFHRNAMPEPGTASGILSLIYAEGGAAELLAKQINQNLEKIGFQNLGITERPGIAVLRQTKMPAVLIETGFLDNAKDNEFFDSHFREIAEAIAAGVVAGIREEEKPPEYYQIQVGAFRDHAEADRLLTQLRSQGFPAYIIADNGLYRVRAGAFLNLDHAARMESLLRTYGYDTRMYREAARY
ncbi:MAG: N-acetylmuramoyl-L-alanine amidase [Clostridiales bacterium]|nr:N-acetylmuramoyl-L-alanine amidase [Clostridiales bacterium]